MKTLAVLCIVLANVIGGSSYLGQKLALEGLPPATVIVLRNLIAIACMLPWVWFARRKRAATATGLGLGDGRLAKWRDDIPRVLAAGVLGYAAPLLLGIVGLEHSTSGNGSILILLEPPAIVFFSWLLLRERIRLLQVAGLLLGLVGAARIVTEQAPWTELLASEHARGNLTLALHGILWGLYSPLMLPVIRRHGAVDATFASMLAALVLLVPAALMEAGAWEAGPALAPALGWTLALGVLASFLGTVLWSASLAVLDASAVAPFVFLQPLAGVLAGHLVLGETLSQAALLGALLIGAGVLLVIGPGLRARRPRSAGVPG
ncbi:MAG: DMT family transporter [Planctomycetota bacterium]|jgi:drug/metabolite transporter (DMT)-like permease